MLLTVMIAVHLVIPVHLQNVSCISAYVNQKKFLLYREIITWIIFFCFKQFGKSSSSG